MLIPSVGHRVLRLHASPKRYPFYPVNPQSPSSAPAIWSLPSTNWENMFQSNIAAAGPNDTLQNFVSRSTFPQSGHIYTPLTRWLPVSVDLLWSLQVCFRGDAVPYEITRSDSPQYTAWFVGWSIFGKGEQMTQVGHAYLAGLLGWDVLEYRPRGPNRNASTGKWLHGFRSNEKYFPRRCFKHLCEFCLVSAEFALVRHAHMQCRVILFTQRSFYEMNDEFVCSICHFSSRLVCLWRTDWCAANQVR